MEIIEILGDNSVWFEKAVKDYGAVARYYMEKNKFYLKQNGIDVFMEFHSKEKLNKFLEEAKSTIPFWRSMQIFVIDTNIPMQQDIWRRFIR